MTRGVVKLQQARSAYAKCVNDRRGRVPMKLRSACLTPGCGGPVVYRGRCAECVAMIKSERPSAARQGDNRAWQQTRAEFLSCHPRCEMNDAKAFETHRIYGDVATDVDHVVPKAAGGGDDGGNLHALCHRCHARRTRQRQLTEKG